MDYFTHKEKPAIPIVPVTAQSLNGWLKAQSAAVKAWVTNHQYAAKADTAFFIPDGKGGIVTVLAGYDGTPHIWSLAHLPMVLPNGTYRIDAPWALTSIEQTALGFTLAQYVFDRYRKAERKQLMLALPKKIDLVSLQHKVEAIFQVRDLINTPGSDMAPQHLAAAAKDIAKHIGAKFSEIVGDDLLKQNYPAVHAVGRASKHAPRFIKLTHGDNKHPHVVLVGKGVTFDTGGLDIKPLAGMKLMKKDMGGAALMLGLARLIAEQRLPIRLTVLIPAVENAIGGNAFRPQDILQTRKGLTVEIGSTDAEGRLILADALAEADRMNPALIIDVATLTGAARTALGAELPALYTNRDEVALGILKAGVKERDPMWHMPLWPGYAKYVNSPIADITNSPNYAFAGSITAALFLERFVSPSTPWVHIDSYAWNPEAAPGRPLGGEALCLRALFTYLKERFTN